MGWYNEPEQRVCTSCGHKYEFLEDTIFMAVHGTNCPKCKSPQYEVLEKPKDKWRR